MSFEDFFYIAMGRAIVPVIDIPFSQEQDTKKGLNLGAGNKTMPGILSLDYPNWDADVDDIPAESRSIDFIHAYHFFEHCKDPVRVLLECQRVLKKEGVMNICVPYYKSQMQAQDLDHKCVFCEDTWKNLFNNQYYDKNKIEWKFKIGFNMICGVVERNICLLTQLIKISE